MIYFKGVLIGFGTALLGCLVAPIALVIWTIWRSQGREATVAFSTLGLARHLAYSLGFWIFIIVLFAAGLVPTVLFPKK